MSKGHQIEVSRGEEPFGGAASDLPHMLIVDQHGHYWRAYDDHYSMPAVSDENTAIEIVASYVLQRPEDYFRDTVNAAHETIKEQEPDRDTEVARIARFMAIAYETSDRLVQGNPRHTTEQAAEHFASYLPEAAALYDAGLRTGAPPALDVERLTEAIWTVYPFPGSKPARADIERIAAEYAALTGDDR